MSDISVAPAPSAPSSSPSQGETPIATNPVNIPNPISNQVTNQEPQETPDDSSAFRAARRDTIAKAFQRAGDTSVKLERSGPRKAQMGDNNPPEAMVREADKSRTENKSRTPPFDLKKKPIENELPHEGRRRRREERQRDEASGRFAAQSPQRSEQQQPGRDGSQPSGQAAPIANPLPPHAAYREPPARGRGMSHAALRDWGTTPETVRGDFHRMHKEFSQASQRMRASHEVMRTIAPFHQMAQQHGTTLARALHNYTSMEDKLRADPIGGIDVIISNLNLRTEDGQRLGSRDVAYEILRRSPEQHQLMQAQNGQAAQAQRLAMMEQRQRALEHHNAQMYHQQQFVYTRGQVDRFAETHPRLDELGAAIERELKLGFDLPTAYRRADLLYPAGSATQAAKTRNTPGETRADRSITGAPDRSLNGGPRRKPSANPREAVANAMRLLGGR
jgi:hypothetical protein